MSRNRKSRLIDLAIECYPSRWKQRHGQEATEIAAALMQDGIPMRTIAWSYLTGAARSQITMTTTRRFGTTIASAVLVGSLIGVPSTLAASSTLASTKRMATECTVRKHLPPPVQHTISAKIPHQRTSMNQKDCLRLS